MFGDGKQKNLWLLVTNLVYGALPIRWFVIGANILLDAQKFDQ